MSNLRFAALILVVTLLAPVVGTTGLARQPPARADSATVAAAAAIPRAPTEPPSSRRPREGWGWPTDPPHAVSREYDPPEHTYGPGHRGIDIALVSDTVVRAPAAGVVAFAGRVVDRSVITIDHGDGFVTTLEPVEASVTVGDEVKRGDTVGEASVGGHTPPGSLHVGVRFLGEYVDPLDLLGDVPWAILLPSP